MSVLVSQMGFLYRLSDKNYKAILKSIAAGHEIYLEKAGVKLGQIEANLTDMKAEDAQYELNNFKETP